MPQDRKRNRRNQRQRQRQWRKELEEKANARFEAEKPGLIEKYNSIWPPVILKGGKYTERNSTKRGYRSYKVVKNPGLSVFLSRHLEEILKEVRNEKIAIKSTNRRT